MRHRRDPSRPLFHFLDVPFQDVMRHPDALRAMYEQRLDGMIVRGVFSPAEVDGAVAALEQGDVPRRDFPMFRDQAGAPYTVGQPIVGADPALTGYFRDAATQRERIARLFPEASFEERIRTVFSALAGGMPAHVAPGPEGASFTPATVRVLPEGHEIGVHVGNEFIRMPQARHLQHLIDMTDQVSFFVPLSVPEGGGELVVYGLEWNDVRFLMPRSSSPDEANVWLEGSEVFAEIDAMDSTAFAPGPGDMLVFDGGRYFHRVSRVVGARPRRTIGGFLGFSQNHDRVLYWS